MTTSVPHDEVFSTYQSISVTLEAASARSCGHEPLQSCDSLLPLGFKFAQSDNVLGPIHLLMHLFQVQENVHELVELVGGGAQFLGASHMLIMLLIESLKGIEVLLWDQLWVERHQH